MWTAIFCAAFFAAVVALGDFVSTKTNGVIGTILVAMFIYIIGFHLGIIPVTALSDTGFLTITSTCGMLITVTNLGTMVDIKGFIREWKIVVISIVSLAVMGLAFLTVGAVLFGITRALVAYPPVAGGMTAVVMISDHVTAIGKPEYASFAWFLVTLQNFVGIPVASFFLRRYCNGFVTTDAFRSYIPAGEGERAKKQRFSLSIPSKYNSDRTILAKLLAVTCLASWLGTITPIPVAIYCLILGVLGCEIGILDRNALQKSGMMNLFMFCMMASAPNSFATLSISDLLAMVVPVAFFLVAGAVSLSIGGALIGRLLHMPVSLAIPLALNAMYGFPFNIMICEDVIRTMDLGEEDRRKLSVIIQPQMTIAGFASMTIMSVIIAALVIPFVQ